jgi:2-desacetyl-2-hydroxyethyl bacteriochlorophyllide A dehydrogenase
MKIKKITFTQPGKVEVQTVDTALAIAAPTEAIIKNHYSLVSAGTELACLAGTESWFHFPGTPGYIAVGEVVDKGAAVTRVNPGDLVFTHGPHAGYFKINTTSRYGGLCLKLPAGLQPDLAPFTRMGSVAITAVRVARIEIGDTVLVTGLGQVGNLAAQFATLQGARVIGVDLSGKRRAGACECGIRFTVDAAAPDWKEQVRRIASGRGISTYIDATGLSAVITEAGALLAPYGEAILLGSPRGPFQTNVTDIYNRIHLPGFTSFQGALEWRYPTFKDEFVKHSIERNSEIVMELIAEGRLRLAPLYTHKVAPERAAEVYAGLRDQKDEYIGVVFDWTG